MSRSPLLTFYGDDFTGSTDVMEALSSNGIETVLFTRLPSPERVAAFPGARAIGLAGTSRSQSPEWMDAHLPTAFAWLAGLGARFCHYKVCSTFDSAPHRGSIGRAMELGLAAFNQKRTHLVVGAPQLRRYTFAGHLFAGFREGIYRIDRHPVMSRHPATPMHESDLVVHLGAQTDLTGAAMAPGDTALARPATDDARFVLLDVHDPHTQAWAGERLETDARAAGPFLVGSSGIEYALLTRWRESEEGVGPVPSRRLVSEDRIAVVSGSCSATTARQIQTACTDGFDAIPVDYARLLDDQTREAVCEDALAAASASLDNSRSPIVHTAMGTETAKPQPGADAQAGLALGRILATLQERHSLNRIAIAGGDTSSHGIEALGLDALTLRHPIPDTPGSPLCTGHDASGERFEIALKGGQIGADDYFPRLRDGRLDR
ncbi:MAG: Hrp-dependent type III effector protein [Stappia sp.]|uniref:four-carbon acid sugar kinase family protein n=1 Tax=Stappia sp. TaxID=1870903 RepID=UPI000C5EE9D0|nr:four-carbon acid sugar kinase family protein [Stappia sp.]MAA96720.1 Hrp-dependent type III effector protein [Stappia sp.]MBM21838.1 Hrp-dependent type III effector protein [Stappia sp.]